MGLVAMGMIRVQEYNEKLYKALIDACKKTSDSIFKSKTQLSNSGVSTKSSIDFLNKRTKEFDHLVQCIAGFVGNCLANNIKISSAYVAQVKRDLKNINKMVTKNLTKLFN